MFFILSKILQFIASPLSWMMLLFIIGLIQRKRRQRFFMYGVVLLIFFTNPFIINLIMQWWEVPSRNIKTIETPYAGGIVLGGAMRYYNSTMQRPVFGSAVDRLMQAVVLYKAGKIKKIILSGGSGLMMMQDPKEADIVKDLLLKMGIPKEDIILESISRNTYENAVNTIALLKSNNISGRFLLITSGYHMRRSLSCFEKAGFVVEPYAVDECSGKPMFTPDKLLIPEAANLETWDQLVHEWIGFLSYKMAGYI